LKEKTMARDASILTGTLVSILILLMVEGCARKKPVDPGAGEEELITTLNLTLTEQGTSSTVTYAFRDTDGVGGAPASLDTIRVVEGKTYNATVEMLDESASPSKDITDEVREEAEEHQLWFTPAGGFSSATITLTDKESDYGTQSGTDHPVGLAFRLIVTAGAGDGTLTVALDHYGAGEKTGSARSGETDIEVSFPVRVIP
jgi:hypothetical protein